MLAFLKKCKASNYFLFKVFTFASPRLVCHPFDSAARSGSTARRGLCVRISLPHCEVFLLPDKQNLAGRGAAGCAVTASLADHYSPSSVPFCPVQSEPLTATINVLSTYQFDSTSCGKEPLPVEAHVRGVIFLSDQTAQSEERKVTSAQLCTEALCCTALLPVNTKIKTESTVKRRYGATVCLPQFVAVCRGSC